MEQTAALKEIAQQIAVCQRCELHKSRKNPVPGAGPATAEVMCIGEGPGFYENEQGLPFVGASGKFLTHLLQQGGYQREQVFITNVVKCRPPENRDPQVDELAACAHYLDRQIELIDPRIIVTLGRFSMARFLPDVRISQVHGKAGYVDGRLIVPMYHPAAALHNPNLRSVVEADFAKLPGLIERANQRIQKIKEEAARLEADQTDQDNPAVQLKLF
ncbi:MAG: uracil-DNA glycosylase [Anaerolineae bacterium]|nr:uracil-DNA glycosylase [Anaerolineae bacterium]